MSRFLSMLMVIVATGTSPEVFSSDVARLPPTFGTDGIVRIGTDTETLWAKGAVIQPDGKLVIAGSSSDKKHAHTMMLVRLSQNGQIDEQFGDKGIVTTKIGANSYPANISLMPDGRIIVAGWSYVSEKALGITLAMYTPSGALDPNFASRGILIFPKDYLGSTIQTLAVQGDGKILVSGQTIGNRPLPYIRRLPRSFLARINSDGTFDSTFGDHAVIAQETPAWALKVLDDGKILAARVATSGQNASIIVARYNADGSSDNTFGGNGSSVIPTTFARLAPSALFVLKTGKIVALLGSQEERLPHRLLVVKLNPDGSPDSEFGQRGISISNTQFSPYADLKSTMDSDGTYWIAGQSLRPRKSTDRHYFYSFGIVRLLSDGRIDTSLGSDGMRVLTVGSETDDPRGVVVQHSGGPLLIGRSASLRGSQIVAIRF